MHNLHPYVCSVIPPHVIARLAEAADGETRAAARATLDEMSGLAVNRSARLRAEPLPPVLTNRKRRHVYDAGRRRKLPGKLVMSDRTRRSSDVHVLEAYSGAGQTLDFLAALFGRRSLDGKGLRVDATVHYGQGFSNAMWTGRQVVFGDGDGRYFNRFTSSIDVIAHELMHGVTQYATGLGYTGEAGALNEHLSDAFGIMVRQFVHGQSVFESDWLIGSELLGPAISGKGIRSLAAPGTAYDDPVLGKDPQPAHMCGYVDDPGAVHVNSGIPNHAFYLAATEIGGDSWESTGRIWYAAMTSPLRPDARFADFAAATIRAAAVLYGAGSRVERAVSRAWEHVGVDRPLTALPIRAPAAVASDAAETKWRDRPVRRRPGFPSV